MEIVRVLTDSGPTAAVRVDGEIKVPGDRGLAVADLVRAGRSELWSQLDSLAARGTSVPTARLLAPVDGRTEVWAAGVTYVRSRAARMAESDNPDSYELVYDADRPELFFKSAAWRVVGPDAPISIRRDSTWNVPEPELAVVCDPDGVVLGYTICNDVSSRSIEGENPLYLPQAKVYLGGCALGPAIVPRWRVDDPYDLLVQVRVRRGDGLVWADSCSTGQLHRRIDDLVTYLFREDVFPDGVVLSTGTGLVPDDAVSLQPDDVVEIEIGELGTLRNRVVAGTDEVVEDLAHAL